MGTKIQIDSFGEVAAVLQAKIRELQHPAGVELQVIAGAVVMCLSACVLLAREIDAMESKK